MKYWEARGKTGHRIYRFRMERMENQPPPPWEKIKKNNSSKLTNENLNCEVEEDEEESKENVSPDQNNFNNNNNNAGNIVSNEDLSHVDCEIENCIKFFCKVVQINNGISSNDKSDESDFQGWDNV